MSYYVFRIRDGAYYVATGLEQAKRQAAADMGLTVEQAERQPQAEAGRCFWFPAFVGAREMRTLWWQGTQGQEATFADRLAAIQDTLIGPTKFFEIA